MIDTIEKLLKLYPVPDQVRMDNGPECINHALQKWSIGSGCTTTYIPSGSPRENPFMEMSNSRFRDEFLNIELFKSMQEAMILAERRRLNHNTYRPC